MCPLVNELKKRNGIEAIVCVTGQHRQMLDQVLKTFDVTPDYDLNIMKDRQTLFDITTNILERIKEVLEKEKPDVVLVHGDTSTTFVTALACYYMQILFHNGKLTASALFKQSHQGFHIVFVGGHGGEIHLRVL